MTYPNAIGRGGGVPRGDSADSELSWNPDKRRWEAQSSIETILTGFINEIDFTKLSNLITLGMNRRLDYNTSDEYQGVDGSIDINFQDADVYDRFWNLSEEYDTTDINRVWRFGGAAPFAFALVPSRYEAWAARMTFRYPNSYSQLFGARIEREYLSINKTPYDLVYVQLRGRRSTSARDELAISYNIPVTPRPEIEKL